MIKSANKYTISDVFPIDKDIKNRTDYLIDLAIEIFKIENEK